MLVFLVVHSGLMELAFLAKNDAEHYLPELRVLSPAAQGITRRLPDPGWGIKPHSGQYAEVLCRESGLVEASVYARQCLVAEPGGNPHPSFKHYYLKRASWKSQEEFKTHVLASWPEYNHRYAHPFEWTWTNQKMRQWFARHCPEFIARVVSGDR